MATVDGLTLFVPGRHVRAVGYHEAKSPEALTLQPLGRLIHNDNRDGFKKSPATAGPDFVILASRLRGTTATTAVDVAMPADAVVLSPITGRVKRVQHYRLYKYWDDIRVEITPGRGSDLVVVAIHLTNVTVERGSQVVAGVTPLGNPRPLEASADIEEFAGRSIPHVHLEVKRVRR
jgi:hypothetical protein